jgi:hypothetical protein
MRIRVTSKMVLVGGVCIRYTCKGKRWRNRNRNLRHRPRDSVKRGEARIAVKGVWKGC